MRKLAPGVYEVGGGLELDIPELLRVHGYADTPENRDLLTEVAKEVAAELWPGVPVFESRKGGLVQ